MNKILYWKQRIPLICLHLICMISLTIFLLANKNSIDSIVLILLVWSVILSLYLIKKYFSSKKQACKLLGLNESLTERYLFSEIMDMPEKAEDQVYYQILKSSNKSMLEKINLIYHEKMEYKEYVEQWIHEIKTPITAMKLICENNRSSLMKELLVELEKTNGYTEQALYYARAEHMEKDYLVRELRVFDVVHQAIAENKYLLLQQGVRIDLMENDDTVFSDEKWLCFILNQLIVNAVKYRSDYPLLRFYTETNSGKVILFVEDNGIGIDECDLPRIFEKGFTGKNGRNATQNATGIGLYLCRKMCNKLGVEIAAKSSKIGTVFQLSFFINDFVQEVQG